MVAKELDVNNLGHVTKANCIGGIIGSTISIAVIMLCITIYRRNPMLRLAFNRILMFMLLAQLAIAVMTLVCSSMGLAGSLNRYVCNISATIDIVSSNFAMMMNATFFYAVSRLRFNLGLNVGNWILFSASLAVTMDIATWIVLMLNATTEAMEEHVFMTMNLGWCSIPDSPKVTNLTYEWRSTLHAMNAFLFATVLIIAAMASFFHLRFIESRRSNWSQGKDIIKARFFGTAIIPIVVYGLGAGVRFDNDNDTDPVLRFVCSLTYPLWGGANALLFLWTEKLLVPAFTGKFDTPTPTDGFTVVVRAMVCSTVSGQLIPSFLSEAEGILEGIRTDPFINERNEDSVHEYSDEEDTRRSVASQSSQSRGSHPGERSRLLGYEKTYE